MTDAEICKQLGWEQRRLDSTRKALAAIEGPISYDRIDRPKDEKPFVHSIPDPDFCTEDIVLNAMEAADKKKMVGENH